VVRPLYYNTLTFILSLDRERIMNGESILSLDRERR
jgi:hypothetical protein